MYQNEKMKFLRNLSQEELLRDVILNKNESHEIKKHAISYLNQEELLIKAFWGVGEQLKLEILEKELPEEFLSEVVCRCIDEAVIESAISKIYNSKLLTGCVFWVTNKFKCEIVSKISDKQCLAIIATNEQYDWARFDAAKKVNEQSVLEQLVLKDTSPIVRKVAAKKIINKKILEWVALNDTDVGVREAAAVNLKDEEVIKKICLNPLESSSVKSVIIDRVHCQSVHKSIATDKRLSTDLRVSAVEKITDQIMLQRIAQNSNNSSQIRYIATGKIVGQEALAQIAMTDQNEEVRKVAIERLDPESQQAIIEQLAVENQTAYKGFSVRMAAISKLSSQKVLKQVALNDIYTVLRNLALKKITDNDVIADLALTDKNKCIRGEALEMLTNEPIIENLAKTLKNEDDCVILLKKIHSKEVLKDIRTSSNNWFVKKVCDDLLSNQDI